MAIDNNYSAILELFSSNGKNGLSSTGARVVDYQQGLYNVSESADDPLHVPNQNGVTWKQLLIEYGINSECYVTNPGAEGTHPDFSIGGHMTSSQNGIVPSGGISYLMPLCSWHNSSSRNRVLFDHSKDTMLELTGYMQGELVITFRTRMPSEEPYVVLYNKDEVWRYNNISKADVDNDYIKDGLVGCSHYILIERVRNGKTLHFLREHNSTAGNYN